jgi:archaellum component FlaC
VEAVNEHLKLKEQLDKHGILTQDIDKLLNLLSNAKENGFDSKKIVTKLRSIKRLEKKQIRLKSSCEKLSKQLQEYKEILPLTKILQHCSFA